MVEYVTLVNVVNNMFNDGYTMKELHIELGIEFTEYMNRLFDETYETIKDEPKNVRIKAGIIYLQNKV